MRLFADRFDGPVLARSRDLGPAGIFVEVAERLAVGTPVVCEVILPSGPVRLAGLVAREQPLKSPEAGARTGLGIQFVNIDERARAELDSLIPSDERTRQLVAVHLEGMKDALRSEAIMTPDGLRVTATLPFLRDGGEVKVAFLSGASRVESRSVVRDVRLTEPGRDGAPRLELRLQFVATAPSQDHREEHEEVTEVTQVDTPSGIATAAMSDTPSGRATAALGEILTRDRALTRPMTGEDSGNTVRVRAPLTARKASPAHTMSAIPVAGEETGRYPRAAGAQVGKRAAVATLALAAGLALVAFGAILNRFVVGARTSSSASAPVVTARPLPGALPGEPGATAGLQHAAPPGTTIAESPALKVSPRPAQVAERPAEPRAVTPAEAVAERLADPGPAAKRTQPPVATDSAAAKPAAVAAKPMGETPVAREQAAEAPAQPGVAAARLARLPVEATSTRDAATASGITTLPVGTPGPAVTTEGGEIVAVVPVEGSTAGAVHYPLTSPRGLAIDLPEARSILPVGRHAIFNDGFRFISIREREGGGLRLAFTYAYYTPRLLDVTIEEKAIRVRVAPAH